MQAESAREQAPIGRTSGRVAIRVALAALLAGVLALALNAVLVARGTGIDAFVNTWVYNAVMVGAAGLCLIRGFAIREERAVWLAFGVGTALWAAGEIYWTAALSGLKHPPYPSPADAGYLAAYPLAFAALLLLLRRRLQGLSTSFWLDTLLVALAATTLGAPLLSDLTQGHPTTAELATTLGYPLGDLILIALVVGAIALTGAHPGRAVGLVLAGLATTAVADVIYTYQSTAGTYVEGAWLDALWPLSASLLAFAAWQRPSPPVSARVEGWRTLAVPSACAFAVLGFGFLGGSGHENALVEALTAATLLALLARMLLAFADNRALLARARSEPTTGLRNRTRLLEDLGAALDGRDRTLRLLALFDLDGFKAYNDAFGHSAGDALLARFGRRLSAAVAGAGGAYRVGGDEFCVLLSGRLAEMERRLADASRALTEHGHGFEITSSSGAVVLPHEADTSEAALEKADERMYASKDSRRITASRQAEAVLLRVVVERHPELRSHAGSVALLAVKVGERLGLELSELQLLSHAAGLHDIGKIAIPDAILSKPGPLTGEEWEFVRQHTVLGERILSSAPSLAPVARIVRSTHERVDGDGYPDGLAGEEIPLAARIIFACDAYDTMTSERPYAAPVSSAEALEELDRCAGTQFDPNVVSALRDVVIAAEIAGRREASVSAEALPVAIR